MLDAKLAKGGISRERLIMPTSLTIEAVCETICIETAETVPEARYCIEFKVAATEWSCTLRNGLSVLEEFY